MTIINRFTTAKPKQKQTGRKYRSPLYDTVRWRNVRKYHIMNNPVCGQCREKGIITPATVLDHIINIASLPEDKRTDMFWDETNHQGLCTKCHNKKSRNEKTI